VEGKCVRRVQVERRVEGGFVEGKCVRMGSGGEASGQTVWRCEERDGWLCGE
jgi:hypothetical protein